MNMNVQQVAFTHLSSVLKANPLTQKEIEKLTGKRPTERQLKKSQEKFTRFAEKVDARLAKINDRAEKREAKRLAKEAKKAKKDAKKNGKGGKVGAKANAKTTTRTGRTSTRKTAVKKTARKTTSRRKK